MSKDIPKAPLIYRTYSSLRSLLSPKFNVYYFLIESLVFAFGVSSLLFIQFNLDPIILAAFVLSILILGSYFYASSQPEKKEDPVHVMNISIPVYFVLSSVGVGGFYAVSYYLGSITNLSYGVMVLIAVYSVVQMNRSRKFLGNRDYYTDEYSEANAKWKRASVALEQALHNNDKKNERKAYFWAKKAESMYESLVEEEERIMPRQAAGAFSAASGFVAASVFTEGNHSYSLWKAAEKSIGRAQEHLKQRVCDNCGRKESIKKCKGVMSDEGRVIFCQRCYQRKKSAASEKASKNSSRNRTNRKTRSSSSSSSRTQDNSRSTRNSSRSSSNDSSKDNKRSTSGSNAGTSDNSKDQTRVHRDSRSSVSRSEALKILGLDEANSTSEVHGAFRSQVKDAHPDMGGSEEEFKRVKEAREVLLDQL